MNTRIHLASRNRASDATDESGNRRARGEPVDDRPRSVYEIVTRRMLEELKDDVGEVKSRVNTLLWLVAGAVTTDN